MSLPSRAASLLVLTILMLGVQGCGPLTNRMWQRPWVEEGEQQMTATVERATVSTVDFLVLHLHVRDNGDQAASHRVLALRPERNHITTSENGHRIERVTVRTLVEEQRGKSTSFWPLSGDVELAGEVARNAVSKAITSDNLQVRRHDSRVHRHLSRHLAGHDWAALAGEASADEYLLIGWQSDPHHPNRRLLVVASDAGHGAYYLISWEAAQMAANITYQPGSDGMLSWRHTGPWIARYADDLPAGKRAEPSTLAIGMEEIQLHTRRFRPQSHGVLGIAGRVAATPIVVAGDMLMEPAVMFAVLATFPVWMPYSIITDHQNRHSQWNPQTVRWE